MKDLQIEIHRINHSIDLFAMFMKKRMENKAIEGWRGWDDKKYEGVLIEKLKRNIEQMDKDKHIPAIDAANFLMMIWCMNLPKMNF